MPSSAPTIPTYATGDTIEASWANDLKSYLLLLDARTGGDPGAAGRFLVGAGALAGIWTTGAAAVLAALGYTPANAAGQAFTNAVTWGTNGRRTDTAPASLDLITASGWYYAASGTTNNPSAADYLIEHVAHPSGNFHFQKAYDLATGLTYFRFNGGSGYSGWLKTWTELNDGASSGLAAQTAADASALGGLVTGTSSGQIPVRGSGGRIDIAALADLAGDANTVDGKAPGTTAGTIAFYNGAGKVVAALAADTAANAALLDSIDSTGFQLEVTPLSATNGAYTLTTSVADVPSTTLTLSTAGKWLVTAKAICVQQATDGTIIVTLVQDAATTLDQGNHANPGFSGTVAMTAIVTSNGSTTVKVRAQKASGASTSALGFIAITAAYISR